MRPEGDQHGENRPVSLYGWTLDSGGKWSETNGLESNRNGLSDRVLVKFLTQSERGRGRRTLTGTLEITWVFGGLVESLKW